MRQNMLSWGNGFCWNHIETQILWHFTAGSKLDYIIPIQQNSNSNTRKYNIRKNTSNISCSLGQCTRTCTLSNLYKRPASIQQTQPNKTLCRWQYNLQSHTYTNWLSKASRRSRSSNSVRTGLAKSIPSRQMEYIQSLPRKNLNIFITTCMATF